MLKKGLVQVYTGDGKGKTTAALGLALRAAGRGNSVLFFQFLKPPSIETGERMAIQKAGLDIEISGLDVQWDMLKSFKDKATREKTRAEIKKILAKIGSDAAEGKYDIIVLDEIVFCAAKGLADIEDVRSVVESRKENVEIVLTGSDATEEIYEMADLVTEMKKIKHPFDKGIGARESIEY
jgi:cob(I)alamin adenosyltransferase